MVTYDQAGGPLYAHGGEDCAVSVEAKTGAFFWKSVDKKKERNNSAQSKVFFQPSLISMGFFLIKDKRLKIVSTIISFKYIYIYKEI
jgi:hypothetical protein